MSDVEILKAMIPVCLKDVDAGKCMGLVDVSLDGMEQPDGC